MTRPARDLCIAYESARFPTKGKVPSGTLRVYRQGDPRTLEFNQIWSACGPRQDDDSFALTNILSLFRHLTQVEGVPAELVRAEFMNIEEFADQVSGAPCVKAIES